MTARVVLHLPAKVHVTFRDKKIYALHAAIERLVLARGGRVVLADREADGPLRGAQPGDGDLHVVENGHVQGPGWLNAALAYLDGFFHLDPEGVLADSSVRHLTFAGGADDAVAAQHFLASLRARFVARRQSRYGQKRAVENVPQGAIAVFLQGPAPERHGQAHLTTHDMLCAVWAGAGGRPVLVKPHPLKPELGAAQIRAAAEAGARLIPTGANVHDILAGAAVSVSINSATGFEGLLHGTPAIFCGRTDFPYCVETIRHPADFAAALDRALVRPPDYAAALHWYFAGQCIWLDDPAVEDKILNRFAAQGFPPRRLGLK